jgi:hypothetical protein
MRFKSDAVEYLEFLSRWTQFCSDWPMRRAVNSTDRASETVPVISNNKHSADIFIAFR